MATDSEPKKKRARHGFRYQMELYFASEDAKQAFLSRIGDAKRLLATRGSPPLDNRELICSLLDKVEAAPPTSRPESLAGGNGAQSQSQTVPVAPMLENSGLPLLKFITPSLDQLVLFSHAFRVLHRQRL